MATKARIIGFVVAVMALSPSIVFADNGGNFAGGKDYFKGGHECYIGKRHHLMARVLNLTEDQQKQLKSIKQKQRETMKSAFQQIRSNREAFNAEIMKAAPDMNKINGLQAQLKTIQSQLADNHLNSILEIKKIMTPEQFAGYMALQKERRLIGKRAGEHKEWGNKGGQEHPSDSD